MFVKKVCQLVKPFLANLHSTISKKYSHMYLLTPNFYNFLKKNIKDMQNLKYLEKNAPRKCYLPKTNIFL